MFNSIINNLNIKNKYDPLMIKLFEKNIIKNMLDALDYSITNYFDIRSNFFKFYNTIKKVFTEHIQTKNKFYIVNINSKFNFKLLIDSMPNFDHVHEDQNKYTKADLLISKKKIFLIFKNLNNFIDFYDNESLHTMLKTTFSRHKVNFILFAYENSYRLINKLNKKDMFDIIIIDCLQKFILENYKDYGLLRFLHSKNIKHIDTPINNNFNYIENMCINLKKLNLKTYNKQSIKEHLKVKLFNQDEAVDSILFSANKLKANRNSENKPIGSWLLCGPSGSGKTELAKILTYSLFSSYDNLIKIDMSEYMESNSSSKLIGSPPGYSGYGKDTILSKNFRHSSSFVVLFDEIEKADKNIFNLMLQLLDEGRITLADGNVLNFNKSFIIFTSNIGYSNELKGDTIDKKLILSKINEFFKIEFLNRLNNIIIFNSLDSKGYEDVFNKFNKDLAFKFLFYINFFEDLQNDFINYSQNVLYGSRPIKRYIEHIFYKINYYKTYRYHTNNYKINYINNFYKSYLLNKKFNPLVRL